MLLGSCLGIRPDKPISCCTHFPFLSEILFPPVCVDERKSFIPSVHGWASSPSPSFAFLTLVSIRNHCDWLIPLQPKPKGLLHMLPAPNSPWSSIAMDFVGPFPEVHVYDYLLVVICQLTLLVHLIPTVTTARAMDIAWIYLKDIMHLHRLPDTIVSDRDPKFISKF